MGGFSSTVEEDCDPLSREDLERLSRAEQATVQGIHQENEILKQKMELLHEQLRRLIGMYGTLENQLNDFKAQWYQQLNVRVNHGPTAPDPE